MLPGKLVVQAVIDDFRNSPTALNAGGYSPETAGIFKDEIEE